MEYLLEMNNITKAFPGVLALDDVTLQLKKGEVLALLGENGAGKSTLIKILSGSYFTDKGQIVIEGEEVKYKSPLDAIKAGVGVIYQELNYLNTLSIAENIFLGNLPLNSIGKVKWKKLKQDTQDLMDIVGLPYTPMKLVGELSVGEKQLIEIARAISTNARICVMDEPTSALTESETFRLFDLIKTLKEKGISVIYISHRLEEVFIVSDRVQVMRDGKSVFVAETSNTDKDELVRQMVGRHINNMYPKVDIPIGETLLEIENLTTDKCSDISFDIKKGEILGMFGLMGAGRTNIVNSIFGLDKASSGSVRIQGKKTVIKGPSQAIEAGLGYVPNERKLAGLILRQSVRRNLSITCIKQIDKIYRLDTKKEKSIVNKWIKNFDIKTPSLETEIDSLSGGNQQKVVIAKWMATNPKILILNEPTKGIDVGAKTEIYRLMEEFCAEGLGILMISSELPEILAISDRVVVVCEGKITGRFDRNELDQVKLMNAAVGGL